MSSSYMRDLRIQFWGLNIKLYFFLPDANNTHALLELRMGGGALSQQAYRITVDRSNLKIKSA